MRACLCNLPKHMPPMELRLDNSAQRMNSAVDLLLLRPITNYCLSNWIYFYGMNIFGKKFWFIHWFNYNLIRYILNLIEEIQNTNKIFRVSRSLIGNAKQTIKFWKMAVRICAAHFSTFSVFSAICCSSYKTNKVVQCFICMLALLHLEAVDQAFYKTFEVRGERFSEQLNGFPSFSYASRIVWGFEFSVELWHRAQSLDKLK